MLHRVARTPNANWYTLRYGMVEIEDKRNLVRPITSFVDQMICDASKLHGEIKRLRSKEERRASVRLRNP
jgi:hypothetical protein